MPPVRKQKKKRNYRSKKKVKSSFYLEKRSLGVETKFQTYNTNTPINVIGAGYFNLYNSDLTQGTDMDQRLGRQIKPLYMKMRILVTKAAAPAASYLRVMLVQDRQCQSATPGLNLLLDDPAVFNSTYDTLLAKGRFRFLYDKTFNQDNTSNYTKTDMVTIKIPGLIQYTGVAAGIGSAGKNSLFLIAFSDQPVAADRPNLNCYQQLAYIDA